MEIEKINELFSKDSYDTPEDTRRYLGDRFLLNSRWYYYYKFSGIVIRSSRKATKGLYGDDEWIMSSLDVLKVVEGCGGRFCVRGLDNLRKSDEPVIIVSNHMSTLETMIFPCLIAPFRPLTFVVKDSLVKGGVFGPIMRSRDPVVVGRSNPRDDFRIVMEKGGDVLLKQKRSLVIFPQSTRTLEFVPAKFNTMGVKLANKAGVKIIPTAIKTDFWGDGKLMKGFGPINRQNTVYITFGEPLTVSGNGKEEHAQTVNFIQDHLASWNQS